MSLIRGYRLEEIYPRSHNLLGRMLPRLTVLWRHMRERRELSHMEEIELRVLHHMAKRQGKDILTSIDSPAATRRCRALALRHRLNFVKAKRPAPLSRGRQASIVNRASQRMR
jgi:hypothetical protein